MTEEELISAINLIEERLNSGATNVETDGLKATLDLKQLRRRRAELKRELAALQNGTTNGPFRQIQL